MRGSISYNEAFALSTDDRRMIGDQIKENIDLTTKTKMPLL